MSMSGLVRLLLPFPFLDSTCGKHDSRDGRLLPCIPTVAYPSIDVALPLSTMKQIPASCKTPALSSPRSHATHPLFAARPCHS